MDLIIIKLDEEKITKDGLLNLDDLYTEIDDLFISNGCHIIKKEGTATTWTRSVDSHDAEVIWQIQSILREKAWFRNYVVIWQYAVTADDSAEIIEYGDILEEWSIKEPNLP